MIFSIFDAILIRKRPRAAQRRMEIFVGLLTIALGALNVFFGEDVSWPRRLGIAVLCIAIGAHMVLSARRDARRERHEAEAESERDSSGLA